jgi:hypothetical protein
MTEDNTDKKKWPNRKRNYYIRMSGTSREILDQLAEKHRRTAPHELEVIIEEAKKRG